MKSDIVKASVSVSGGQLRIECSECPSLNSGMHRLFFTNIAGFNQDDTISGYSRPLDASAGRAIEAVRKYFTAKSIPFALDAAAQAFLNARQAAGQALEAAREAGTTVHQTELFEEPVIPGFKRVLKNYP